MNNRHYCHFFFHSRTNFLANLESKIAILQQKPRVYQFYYIFFNAHFLSRRMQLLVRRTEEKEGKTPFFHPHHLIRNVKRQWQYASSHCNKSGGTEDFSCQTRLFYTQCISSLDMEWWPTNPRIFLRGAT